jgi:diacylglycerol kinase (ATP)
VVPILQFPVLSMRITLIHNPSAGSGLEAEQLVELLEKAGHKVRVRSTDDDWRKALDKRADLVVAAGGDGTVKRVALALAGGDVAFAILPLGTANNVAKTLGIGGDADQAVRGWDLRAAQPLDVATVTAPWGEGRFIESLGGGLFSELIASGQEIDDSAALLGRPTDRALARLGQLLDEATEQPWAVMVDGQEQDGEYLAVEVLNIRFAGPNVPLAPDADPGDGLLEVALLRAEDRDGLRAYIQERMELASGAVPQLPVFRGQVIRLRAPAGARLHLDDRLWPRAEALDAPAELSIRVQPGAVRLVT